MILGFWWQSNKKMLYKRLHNAHPGHGRFIIFSNCETLIWHRDFAWQFTWFKIKEDCQAFGTGIILMECEDKQRQGSERRGSSLKKEIHEKEPCIVIQVLKF